MRCLKNNSYQARDSAGFLSSPTLLKLLRDFTHLSWQLCQPETTATCRRGNRIWGPGDIFAGQTAGLAELFSCETQDLGMSPSCLTSTTSQRRPRASLPRHQCLHRSHVDHLGKRCHPGGPPGDGWTHRAKVLYSCHTTCYC